MSCGTGHETYSVMSITGSEAYGVLTATPSRLNDDDQYMKKKVRSRHETFNQRMKRYGVLCNVFRHGVDKHALVFYSVAKICQIVLMEESPLFELGYYDL